MFKINKMKSNYEMDNKCINNLRCLSIDMISNAKSGHPGVCLGAATILYTLFTKHMNVKLDNVSWYNRDRFVLSGGHAAPLYYSILFMMGLISLDDCKKLRTVGSITPGHPEISTPLVDASTGPLGQGIGNAVGMAISERYLNTFNKNLFNHYTYCMCGDGDLMEGVSYEALSLAGRLKLNKLIILYDCNNVTLDGELNLSSNEDVITRFKSIGFNIIVVDGDSVKEIDNAINRCKSSDLPNIIVCKTKIGRHSVNEGNCITHGKPLDKDDITNIKNKFDMYDSSFVVSSDTISYVQDCINQRVYLLYKDWNRKYNNLKERDKLFVDKIINGDITYNINNLDIEFDNKSLRDINSDILNDIANYYPMMIGGSCDVSSSTKTYLKKYKNFDIGTYDGRNINFGIREHAMGSIMNGISLSNLRCFGSIFLVFSDYMRASIRMSALMNLSNIYFFTHDSITVGEDGATHQPIEHVYSLDLIPNLYVYRPYDVNELISCYKEIFSNKKPSCLILPRDNKEISELTKANKIENGAYILRKEETDDFICLVSGGEELGLTIEISNRLNSLGIDTRIVSLVCMKNFKNSSEEYKNDIFTDNLTVAITYGIPDYYYYFTKNVIGMNNFGISGNKEDVLDYFGFTVEKIVDRILNMKKENGEDDS